MKLMLTFILAAGIFSACNSSKKTNESGDADITGKYWKLTSIMGKPVGQPSSIGKEMYITLNKTGNTLQGNGGCNSFNGKYELKEGGGIIFTGITATLMACPDMENESAFLKAIESADNYTINDNILQLNKAKMAPLLTFEAIKK